MMSKVVVTGGAGFIGSHLVMRLLERGDEVIVVDNLSNPAAGFVEWLLRGKHCQFENIDLQDFDAVVGAIRGVEGVFHFAANSDIPRGACNTSLDLEQGTIGTYRLLEAMRRGGVQNLVFASTSAVYGEAQRLPTREDDGPLFPISLYGASKLAAEGLISAFVHNYDMRAWIYRFGNVVGRRATHGIIVDFIRKLRRNRRRLEILGDGDQAKAYLHVSDCIDGILRGRDTASGALNYFNLASQGVTRSRFIADIVVNALQLEDVEYFYRGGDRGWPGDVPRVSLDSSKLRQLGWAARFTSDDAVTKAAAELVEER